MNKIFQTVAKATPVMMVLALFCSNPVKDVAWRTSIDLPITANKKFILAAMMDTLFFNKQQVLTTTTYDTIKVPGKPDSIAKIIDTTMMIMKAYPLYDSATKKTIPDTVAFGIPTRDTVQDTISEDSLADKYYSDLFGPLPLSGAPNDTITVPLTGNYTANTQIATPATPVTLQLVYHIELKDTPQTANVTVINNSSADFGSVAITAGNLGTSTVTNLAHNTSDTAQFDARAKIIDSVMMVSVTVTPSTTGSFAAGGTDNLQVILSFNGLVANKVVAKDSLLVNYHRVFTNAYKLTDTVSVYYIDILKGFFNYLVTNNTSLELNMLVNHRNLWTTDYAARHIPPLDSVAGLVGLTLNDSNEGYEGAITPQVVVIPPNQTAKVTSKENLSGYRMFPEWEWNTYDNDSESVTKVDYDITVAAHGTRVTLNAGDSLNFIIRTTSFKFDKMYGVSMLPYHRKSDPKNIPVSLPWSKSVTDSLRNNFILQRVLAKVTTNMNIPAGAYIDTMHVYYTISSTTDTTKTVSDSEIFSPVTRDSTYVRSLDITQVVNNYPDSVRIKVSATVPNATTLMAVNDLTVPTDADYTKYVGRMIIHAQANYNLVAALWWTVADTTVMDLGGTRVDLGGAGGVLDFVEKMRDRHDSLNIKVTNFTNVDLKLYSLIATDTSKIAALVDTNNAGYISTNDFTALINNPTAGFVNLLGSGVWIPPRDSTQSVENTIRINDADLTKLVNAKKIGMRWEVRFLPHPATATSPVPDALSNTDWLKLNSWIHVDGVNSIDSLLQ